MSSLFVSFRRQNRNTTTRDRRREEDLWRRKKKDEMKEIFPFKIEAKICKP